MGQVRDDVAETATSIRTVFSNPALRRIELAFAGSKIGDWAYATAVTVWAYGVGGATAVGVWGMIRLVLLALVTPFAAGLADRLSRKSVMVGADAFRVLLVAASALLIEWDGPVWVIFVLATAAALVGTPFRPAQASMMPSLARTPAELTAANGTASTFESLSFFVGPALAGLLLSVTDVAVVFGFNAVTFLWSALMVAGVRPPPSPATERAAAAVAEPLPAGAGRGEAGAIGEIRADPASSDPPDPEPAGDDGHGEERLGLLREAIAGFKTIWGNRDLRLVTFLVSAQTIVAGASIVFSVSIAVDLIELGPEGVGYLDAMLGVGAVLGGLVAIGRASRQRMGVDLGVGVVLWSLPLVLVAVLPEAAPAFLAMFLLGFANPLVDVNYETIVQRVTPDRVMGRVFGASESALIATMALGSVLMPLLVATVGLRWGMTAIGVGVTAMAVPCFAALRQMDSRLRAPEGLDLLLAIPLFAPLPRPVVERLARQLVRVEVAAGEVVIREGDVGDRFYVIESGAVEATFRSTVLSTAGPGEPFGEIALLHDVPRTATVRATEPTVLLALERDDFLPAVSGNDEAWNKAEALASRRIPTS
jgi:MFS family permease